MATKKAKLNKAISPNANKMLKRDKKVKKTDDLERQAMGLNNSDEQIEKRELMNTTDSMDPDARTSIVKTVKNLRKDSTSRSHNFAKNENNELTYSHQNAGKRPITENNPTRPISAIQKSSTVGEPKEKQTADEKKKFVIGAPSNYEKMRDRRDKLKEEKKQGKVIVPPNPVEAFETMIRRSKALKEFFEQNTDEDFASKYMSKNWHFLTSFEFFLFQMVKDGEVTKEFNNQTKAVARKIEKFIIEKVENYLSFSDLDKDLKTHNSKINKLVRELASQKQKKQRQYENYFANYYIE